MIVLLSIFATRAGCANSANVARRDCMFRPARSIAVVLLALGLAACGNGPNTANTTHTTPTPDHVVLIVVDTLRPDHLPLYGYARDTAPFLTALGHESAVFLEAVSTSTYTPEAIGSLFTGLYPSRSSWGAGWHARPSLNHATLAMHFQKAGYRTAMFSDSPMLDHPEFARGFDTAECMSEFGLSGQGQRLVDQGLAWLERHATEKTFLYLHFLDPHAPYAPTEEAYKRFGGTRPADPVTMSGALRTGLPELVAEGFGPGEARFEDLVQRYDAEIYVVDQALKNLFDGMKALDVAEHTLAIITADHGEEFLEHGFVEHAWKLYPETFRVPMLFWSPGRIAPGRYTGTASLADVYPTLAALQGLEGPERADGYPLFVRDGASWAAAAPDAPRIVELQIQSRCMIRGVVTPDSLYLAYWKYLSAEECARAAGELQEIRAALASGEQKPVDPWGPIVREEYYDLREDPGCRNNIAEAHPETTVRWRTFLHDYGKACPPQLPDAYKATRDPALLTPEQAALLEGVDPAYLHLLDPALLDEESLETLGYL